MKKRKQLFRVLLTGCFILGMFPATAATAAESNWKKAYLDFIEEDTKENTDLRDSAEYQLIYIDDNDIPELWIDYNATYAGGKICTFDGRQVNSISTWSTGTCAYLERGGLFYISGGHMDNFWDSVYILRDGSFEKKAHGTCEVSSWEKPAIFFYEWEGERVSETQYQYKLKSVFNLSEAKKINDDDTYNHVDMYILLNEIEGISLNKHSMTLTVGNQETLTITTEIGGSAAIFKSSNPSVATVDEGCGVVTAVGTGTAVITVIEEGWGNTASCVVTVTTNSNSTNTFTDVATGTWYYEAVKFVSKNGLMNGSSGNLFEPDANLSRAMLTQILYNKEGKPTVTSSSRFTDVSSDVWYTDAVNWAAVNGIVGGYGNGLFGPNDNVTREQLAVMLWRYIGSPTATNKDLKFSDASEAGGYALDALRWAVENGVINGKDGGALTPKSLATRAQVAQMLKNYLE